MLGRLPTLCRLENRGGSRVQSKLTVAASGRRGGKTVGSWSRCRATFLKIGDAVQFRQCGQYGLLHGGPEGWIR